MQASTSEVSVEEKGWSEQVEQLAQEIANDCKLKKKQSSKFIKYMDQATMLWEKRSLEPSEREYLLLAGLYKNLGKLGEHEQCLQKSLMLLKKGGGGPSGTFVRWLLQLTAMKSSLKKNNQCYEMALRATVEVKKKLEEMLPADKTLLTEQQMLVVLILDLAQQQTKDQVLWMYNQKNLQQQLLFQLRKDCPQKLAIPFYPEVQFHISDIMTLETCKTGWQQQSGVGLRELLIYLSIGFFTMATEKYYTQDYSFKHCHVKSLKIALVGFDVNCTYVGFLSNMLQKHFGQRLQSIAEQHMVNGEHNDLLRYLPKDTKQVSMRNVVFCDD